MDADQTATETNQQNLGVPVRGPVIEGEDRSEEMDGDDEIVVDPVSARFAMNTSKISGKEKGRTGLKKI